MGQEGNGARRDRNIAALKISLVFIIFRCTRVKIKANDHQFPVDVMDMTDFIRDSPRSTKSKET